MPTAICKTCGKETNSVVSNYFLDGKVGEITKCFAGRDIKTDKWVRGCFYSQSHKVRQNKADRFIARANFYLVN